MAYPASCCASLIVVARNLCARAIAGFSLVLWAGAVAAFPSAPYFPLPDGATWTYSYVSVGAFTWTVVGTITFNGAQVKVVRDSSGFDAYYTNDASGIRLHGGYSPASTSSPHTIIYSPGLVLGPHTTTYSPPIALAAQDSVFGAPVNSSGTMTIVGESDVIEFGYSATSTPIGVESVTVPAGTFPNAVRVVMTTNYGGLFFVAETVWLVPGIGLVREDYYDAYYNETLTWELSSTNLSVPARRADFNADGKSDVLWRHADGTNYVWHVNGASIVGGVVQIGSQGLLPGVADAGWAIVGIGDFNGDVKADILWRHTNGTNYVWHLDGSTINGGVLTISTQGLLPTVDATWGVAGIGDFNGDGKADILWRRNDGTNYVWHVDGATINSGVLAIGSQGLLPMVDTSWAVAGVGDYNGDSKADVLWRKNDGTNYVWHVDGATINGGVLAIASQGLLPGVDTTWSVVAAGDYNGDGKADILWRRNDGTNYVWHVDGTTINGGMLAIGSQGLLPAVTDTSWSVVGAGDYNGDGKADVLWRHTNGTNYVWHVDGAVINGGVLSIANQGLLPGVADPGWQVQNPK